MKYNDKNYQKSLDQNSARVQTKNKDDSQRKFASYIGKVNKLSLVRCLCVLHPKTQGPTLGIGSDPVPVEPLSNPVTFVWYRIPIGDFIKKF